MARSRPACACPRPLPLPRPSGVAALPAGIHEKDSALLRHRVPSKVASRPRITMEELAQHCTAADAWIAISGKVYDVTAWQYEHPGGQLPLLAVAGGDATDVFLAMHSPKMRQGMSRFLIGTLEEEIGGKAPGAAHTLPGMPVVPSDASAAAGDDVLGSSLAVAPSQGSTSSSHSHTLTPAEQAMIRDYRALVKEVEAKGYMRPDLSYYAWKGLVLLLVLAGVVLGVTATSSPLVHLLCAMVLGMWWNQVNFIGHDAGHNSITTNPQADAALGFLVGNTLTGISIGWWKRSHNVHHVACNSVTHDPDVQHVPLLAVSKALVKTHYSLYHFRQITFDALAKLLVSYQHFTFYPIMAVARINLYIQSLLLLFSRTRLDKRGLEAATMLIFWVWFGTLMAQLPSWWERVAFFFVSHAVTGILHVQICVSHFAKPMYEGRMPAALWSITQLHTTLDVVCPEYVDWFHGGLQFQIEHHLFPRMPRRNLRRVSPLVQDFCKKHDLAYTSFNFRDANIETVKSLYDAAMEARQYTPPAGGEQAVDRSAAEAKTSHPFFQSLLWDGLNARG